MAKVRLGIIGIGNMGSGHARSIQSGACPELEVTAVADLKESRRHWARENLSEQVRIYETGEQLLDSGVVDAVLVAVPHYDHPKYVIGALERGLHALSEKPAGVYTKQVREMNAVADKSDRVFAMMFNQRTDHIYRKMKEIVSSGRLGAIRRTNWLITNWYRPQAYYNSGEWRATWKGEGGGVLLNQCPHQLDLWQWICGMPVRVHAHMSFGKWHEIEVEDDVTAYVEYENGATGTFITSTGDPCGSNRFEIVFEKGKLVAENGDLYMWEAEVSEPEFSKTNTNPFAAPKTEMHKVETDGKSEQHTGVLNAFASAILHGTPLIAKGQEGINGLTLSNAMHLSAWLGHTVELPLDEELFYSELKKRIDGSRQKTQVHEVTSEVASGEKAEHKPSETRWKVNW